MARKRAATFVTILAAGFLTGCVDSQGGFASRNSDTGIAPETPEGATRIVERDIEAPEAFQVTEQGLWDGRPSLGGVWVAYADVKEPERVIIRNTGNGKFVIGALFRRERDNPGPALQVSSDAAATLGMLAGAPAELNVTALKREEVPLAQPGDAAGEELTADAEISAEPIPAAGAETPEPVLAAAAPAPAPKVAAPVAKAPADVVADASPFDAIVAGASAALDRADKTAVGAAPAAGVTDAIEVAAIAPAAAAPAPAPDAPPAIKAPVPQGPKLDKGYIQIGIFSVEQNAKNTVVAMGRAGMVATIKKAEANGKPYWRVIVGPASNAAERTELLKKVKGLGFSDAYLVAG